MKLLGKGCLIIIGIIVVLGIIGALVGTETTEEAARTPSTAAPAASQSADAAPPVVEGAADAAPVEVEPTAEPAPVSYGIGEDVQVGDVRWHLLEATNVGSTLVSDNEYIADATTAGTFVRVRFEVENLTSDQVFFSDVELVDAQERSFNHSSDFEVMLHLPNEEQCALEQLNPNVPQTCQMIFELPADAQNLHLKVGDLVPFRGREAQIALGF